MFDRSLLPPARFEFVVVADTHFMLDPGDRPLEFESRRRQTARSEVALRLASALHPTFILHLGDLVQEYPETDRFPQALEEALAQLDRCGLRPHHVAGNHDVGDKPSPTMPTHPVSPESLAAYHGACGPSWYSFDREGCHFIVLNSQILNSSLPEARAQRAWLEADLAACRGRRTFLFLHLPPYLQHESEPGLGHYDNIDPPARTWLLGLVRTHEIELLAAGHVHFAFFDRIAHTRYCTLPSPAFTRPGFGHLFTGSPAPEQGRDDMPKLGFTLFRVLPDRTDFHFIRTGGALSLAPDAPHRLLTRTSAALPRSPLGLSLLHPLAPVAEVPIAYPSVVRQSVRNDYPLLSALELGAASVRVPWTDLDDPVQGPRLRILRDEGVLIAATCLWSSGLDLPALLKRAEADAWELQIPGALRPPDECLRVLSALPVGTPLSLAPIVAGLERRQGKQHPRTRIGYRPAELGELDRALDGAGVRIDRALCRLSAEGSLWETALELRSHSPFPRIGALDLALDLASLDDARNADLAAEAAFALALLPGARLYLEPFLDLDRTLDISHGLLDPLCNPRPAFQVLRCLNTILYGPDRPTFHPAGAPAPVRALSGPGIFFCLIPSAAPADLPPLPRFLPDASGRLYCLQEATVETGPIEDLCRTARNPAHGPFLLEASLPSAGLCEACRHVRRIASNRGSTFFLCRRSETDARYPRYPHLPTLACEGYEPVAP